MIRPPYLRETDDDCQCVAMGLEERHNEMYECRVCGLCCADEITLSNSNDTYEDKGICVECAMKEDPNLTIEEIAGIVSQ